MARSRLIYIGVFVLALVVRLAYVWEIRDALYFASPVLDAEEYDRLSDRLLAGDWMLSGKGAYVHGPLYTYLFGLVKLTAPGPAGIRVLQAILGALSCLLICLIGQRLRDRLGDLVPSPVPLIAGLIAALYWPFVFFTGELLATTLVILLQLVLALQLLRSAPWTATSALLAGLVLALLVSTRSNTLLLLPLAFWWIGTESRTSNRGWQPRLIFLAATVLFLTPFALRNLAVQGIPVPFQGRWSLYQGTNPDADGTPYARQGLSWQRLESLPYLAGDRTPAARGRYFLDASLAFIVDQPAAYAGLLYRKFRLFWHHFEIPVSADLRYFEAHSRISRLLLTFGLVVPLSLACVIWLRRTDREFLLIGGFVLAYLASGMAFTVCARYRLPALPFLILFTAQGLWLAVTLVRDRRYAHFGAFLLIGAGASALVRTGVDARSVDHLRSDWLQSQVHIRTGHYDRAEVALLRQLSRTPADSDVLNSLASVYNHQGRIELVEATLSQALEAAPDHALPWLNLGDFYVKSGRFDAARSALWTALRHDPRPGTQYRGLLTLGNMSMHGGDHAGARQAFERAARERRTPHVFYALSTASAKLGWRQDQLEALEQSVRLDPNFAPALRNLGALAFEDGNLERAEHLLLRAVRRDPRSPDAFRNLGLVYRKLGNLERANLAFAEARRLAAGRAPR